MTSRTSLRSRVALAALATSAALWLGLTAPAVSPVTPAPPVPTTAPANAVAAPVQP